MTYVVSRPAATDLRGIRDWIARDNAVRAVSYLHESEALFGRLDARPSIGRPREEIGPGVRSMVHGNHVVFYRPVATGVEISRLLHGRRDPRRVPI